MPGTKITSIRIDEDVFNAVKALPYFNLSAFCNSALRAYLLGEEIDILAIRAKIQELKKQMEWHESEMNRIKTTISMLENQLGKKEESQKDLMKAIEATRKLMEQNYGIIPEQRYKYLKDEFGLSREQVDEMVKGVK